MARSGRRWCPNEIDTCFSLAIIIIRRNPRPVASKVLTPGRVDGERLEKVVESKRMKPATAGGRWGTDNTPSILPKRSSNADAESVADVIAEQGANGVANQ